MEFDKSKVYTAVNADELPIGSKCIFARSVFTLKDHLHCDYPTEILISVGTDTSIERFESDSGEWYSLAYLIESPKKLKPKTLLNDIKGKWTICRYDDESELICTDINELEDFLFDSYEDAVNFMSDMMMEGDMAKGSVEQITGTIEEREITVHRLVLVKEKSCK